MLSFDFNLILWVPAFQPLQPASDGVLANVPAEVPLCESSPVRAHYFATGFEPDRLVWKRRPPGLTSGTAGIVRERVNCRDIAT